MAGTASPAGPGWPSAPIDRRSPPCSTVSGYPPPAGPRPSRGALPLRALLETARLTATDLADYDGFHLLLADASAATVWTWDGVRVERTDLAPGDHIIVNEGVDATTDPLVPYFQPLAVRHTGPAGRLGRVGAPAARRWPAGRRPAGPDHPHPGRPPLVRLVVGQPDRTDRGQRAVRVHRHAATPVLVRRDAAHAPTLTGHRSPFWPVRRLAGSPRRIRGPRGRTPGRCRRVLGGRS